MKKKSEKERKKEKRREKEREGDKKRERERQCNPASADISRWNDDDDDEIISRRCNGTLIDRTIYRDISSTDRSHRNA